jgi:hypothetical protein
MVRVMHNYSASLKAHPCSGVQECPNKSGFDVSPDTTGGDTFAKVKALCSKTIMLNGFDISTQEFGSVCQLSFQLTVRGLIEE